LLNPAGTLTVAQMPRLNSLFNIPQSLITPPSAPGFAQVKIGGLKIGEAVDDSIVPPYSINLNFSIGREFTSQNLFVEASYVGRLSRRLLTSMDTAMPTNMKDPKSGQTSFEAAQVLARAGIKTQCRRRELSRHAVDGAQALLRRRPDRGQLHVFEVAGLGIERRARRRLLDEWVHHQRVEPAAEYRGLGLRHAAPAQHQRRGATGQKVASGIGRGLDYLIGG
jgi:hypothetical protein